MNIDSNLIMSAAGAVSVLGGAWLTIQKVLIKIKIRKEEQANRILEAANLKMEVYKRELQKEIDDVKIELHALEHNVKKDMEFLKETHTTQISNLAEKIELLRADLIQQHSKMLELLTSLVNK